MRRQVQPSDPLGCVDHNGSPLAMDERGFLRMGRCDIGAYEATSRVLLPVLRR